MGFQLSGAPRDRRLFEAGIAAHAILEAVGVRTEHEGRRLDPEEIEVIARATCVELTTHGREYRGKPEDPYHPSRVFDGRDVALRWLDERPVEPRGARYEVGLAVDRKWKPVPFGSPEAWYDGILDVHCVSTVEGDEAEYGMLEIEDHKSSWAVEPTEIGSQQQRGYAVLAWCHLPKGDDRPAVLRRRVNALRRLDSWSEDLWLDHGAEETLEGWRKDLDALLRGFQKMRDANGGEYPAAPGGGCASCPYVLQCPAARRYLENAELPEERDEVARSYAVLTGAREELTKWLKDALGSLFASMDEKSYVGYRGIASDTTTDDAYAVLAAEFAKALGREETAPILASFAKMAPPSVAQARDIIWNIFPGEEGEAQRKKIMNRILAVSIRRRFGVHKWPKED